MTPVQPESIAAIISAIALLIGALVQGAKTRAEISKIRAELAPNSGKSLRDQINRIEKMQSDQGEQISRLQDSHRADREQLQLLTESSIHDHADIRNRLGRIEQRYRKKNSP